MPTNSSTCFGMPFFDARGPTVVGPPVSTECGASENGESPNSPRLLRRRACPSLFGEVLHLHANMSATFRNNRSDGSTGEDAGIGGRVASRPSMLDIYFTAGSIIPADPGDGDDDGTKFRDLVWVSDDETV